MNYITRVLQPGEQIRHILSIHWIVCWPSVAVAVLAIATSGLAKPALLPEFGNIPAYGLAFVAAIFW